jgi:TolB-like protein
MEIYADSAVHDLRTHLVRSGPFECISNNSTVRLAQMCCNTEDGVSWQINGTIKSGSSNPYGNEASCDIQFCGVYCIAL